MAKKKRGHKRRKIRMFRIPVTVQAGGLLSTGRKRRIRGFKFVSGKYRSSGKKRRHGKKRRRGISAKMRRARVRAALEAGTLKRGHTMGGFKRLKDNPWRGGSRMARRRKRSHKRRRHYKRHEAMDNPRRRRRRRHNPMYFDGSKKKRHKKRHKKGHRRRKGFYLLATRRRKNPMGALMTFPFKSVLMNGAIGGAGLLGVQYLFGDKGPDFATKLAGAKGTAQHVLVKNGVLVAAGWLLHSFTRFKPAGVVLATVGIANAVKEAGALAQPEMLGDLGLTYETFRGLGAGPGEMPASGVFHGLGSDIVYGSAQPYGLAEGMESDFVFETARPYGTGLEESESESEEAANV